MKHNTRSMTRGPLQVIDRLRDDLAKAEAERDALRAALSIMVKIGYTHESGCHPSEGRHTKGCREKKAALAQAEAALAATEVPHA